ncbi:MAG: hypothetical protein ABF455_00885 [Liquorilactobacillus satsumensis]|uniref:hypothetical protein n=1 Tax=Lactobacillaceae TaxID=33958 RepID=UPI001E5B27BD|nr:hypothetical protein [Leuconostoc pseudomesenteroides]MCC8439663.1 hypothetical protein [Leuconostoc pseudomesenteroides]
MKKVVDERLKLQLIKNFKIAFLVENAVIVLLLIYQSFKNIDKAISTSNPLWTAFIVGTMTLSFLSVNVSASIEDKPKRSSLRLLSYFVLIFIIGSLFFMVTMPNHILLALLCGTVIAVVVSGLLFYENHYRYRDD